MLNLNEFRRQPERLADLLPWAALVAKGTILNKDGSFQRTLQFRGPDVDVISDEALVAFHSSINNLLKNFSSGFTIYVDQIRSEGARYPKGGFFRDRLSYLVNSERRTMILAKGNSFESNQYLTIQYLPPTQTRKRLRSFFLRDRDESDDNFRESLDFFLDSFEKIYLSLIDLLPEAKKLDDQETLTYLHGLISPKRHPVVVPKIPMYLDALLADSPFQDGLAPLLGDQYLGVISILGFPAQSQPAMMRQLSGLSFPFRWMTRFIALDKSDAVDQLRSYRRQWFAKRKGLFNLLQEAIFRGGESRLQDTAALDKAGDAEEGLAELGNDLVNYGYYTSTIVLLSHEQNRLIAMKREIERIINSLGFTTIDESINSGDAWLGSLPGHVYANIRKPLLHTLNLAHLMPLSAIWSGPHWVDHLDAPPLLWTQTPTGDPFRMSNYVGDVGHQLVLGPTGSGKSVLLIMMALQFQRYQNSQVFIFDKGESFLAATLGVGGQHFTPGRGSNELAFQPFANIEKDSERTWALEWLLGLFRNERIEVDAHLKRSIWEALESLAQMPIEHRTITGLAALLQEEILRDGLFNYTVNGPFGSILDAESDFESNHHWQCFEMSELLAMPSVVSPVLTYLFHRLEKNFTGNPTLIILDEAWLYLENTLFEAEIRMWLKSLRKLNVSVIFATQEAADSLNSTISSAILESCPSRIFLPNSRVLEDQVGRSYLKLGLTKKELELLASAIPKGQYYFQSKKGSRLFSLRPGPIGKTFACAASVSDRTYIRNVWNKYGPEDFLSAVLSEKNLVETQDHLQEGIE